MSVSFEVRRELEGDYEVEVEATEAVDVTLLEASFTVGRITPPVAQLVLVPQTLRVSPDTLTSGEPVIVSIDVSNEGQAPGSRTIVLIVDGKEIESKEVTLDPIGIETVSFTLVERGVVTHTVALDGATAEFTVTRPAPLALTIALLVIFALLVGGLARVIYVGATRRRSTPEL